MSHSKRILITGGCGFIGSHGVRHFYRMYPDCTIFNLDVLTYAGNPENLADIEAEERERNLEEKRYHFIRGDICNTQLLDVLSERYHFDAVINFAAETHVDRAIVSMTDFISTNINGVRSLMEIVRAHRIPRFIHISTDEVYGSIPTGTANEDAPLHPSNPYSSSKAAGDLIVQSFVRTHDVPAIIVRGSNNYGPYQYPEKLIPLAISNLLEGKKIPVHGKGSHVRSWLHVEDFCEAIDLVLEKGKVGEIYNVAGEERTNLDILTMLARELQMNLMEHMEQVPDRPGADTRYAPDAMKIKKELGWHGNRNLECNLKDIVAWYLEHREWWQRIRGTEEFLEHYEKQAKGQWY